MAAIDLPPLPRLAMVEVELMDFGGDLTSPLGGPTQRILRLGSRFMARVQMPALDLACAGAWLAVRNRAKAEGLPVRMGIKQLGDGSVAGTPNAVAGAGTELELSAPGATVGLLFSFVKSGVSYLHQVTAVAGVDINVAPALRADPAGLALEFAAPEIEGLMNSASWSVAMARFAGQTFTVTEAR